MTPPDDPTATRVRDALRATEVPASKPGPGSVARTARQRDRRRQRATFALTALALVGGGVLASSLLDRRTTVTLSDEVAAEPGTPTGAGLDLTWTSSEAIVVREDTVLAGDDGAFYALGTAPGSVVPTDPGTGPDDIQRAVYRSEDGLRWETPENPDVPPAFALAQGDGLLYTLGTAPGAARAPLAGVSPDGGATWVSEELPAPAIPEATIPLQSTRPRGRIVTRGETALAMTRRVLVPEPRNDLLTPAEDASGASMVASAEGLDVRDPRTTEVLRTIPYSEVGLSGPRDLLAQGLFLRDGDGTWTVAEEPLPGYAFEEVLATEDGFVAPVVAIEDLLAGLVPGGAPVGLAMARSQDGRSWEIVDEGLPRFDQITTGGVVGDTLVLIGSRDVGEGALVATSRDGGTTWATEDLAPLVDASGPDDEVYLGGASVGPLGVAAVVQAITTDQSPEGASSHLLLTSPDGRSWSATTPQELAGPEARAFGWVAVGADAVATVVAEPGRPRPHWQTFVGVPAR